MNNSHVIIYGILKASLVNILLGSSLIAMDNKVSIELIELDPNVPLAVEHDLMNLSYKYSELVKRIIDQYIDLTKPQVERIPPATVRSILYDVNDSVLPLATEDAIMDLQDCLINDGMFMLFSYENAQGLEESTGNIVKLDKAHQIDMHRIIDTVKYRIEISSAKFE